MKKHLIITSSESTVQSVAARSIVHKFIRTFPRTLCIVSTSDETTHCGICLTSIKTRSGYQRGEGDFGPEIAFLTTIST